MGDPWEIDDADLSSFDLSSFVPSPCRTTAVPLAIDHSCSGTPNPPLFSHALRPCSQPRHIPTGTPSSPLRDSDFALAAFPSSALAPNDAANPDAHVDCVLPRTKTGHDERSRPSFSGGAVHSRGSISRQVRLPGPAGVVQAALQKRAMNVLDPDCGIIAVSTPEYIRRAVEDIDEEDCDFTLAPWVSGLDFVRREAMVRRDAAIMSTPLRSIDRSWTCNNKVPQVVALIKACRPTGLGDMLATLQDPSGTIDASIHRTAVAEPNFGKDITVGAVLILQKVAVFHTSARSVRYLNVIADNVVKVFPSEALTTDAKGKALE